MDSGRFKADDGLAGIFDELAEDSLRVIIFTILQAGETAHSDDVAIACHHRDSLAQMLALVAVHDDTPLRLQLPGPLIDVQHDDVHAQVAGRFLCAQSGAQAVVEEHQQGGLVTTQFCVLVAVLLYLQGLFESLVQVS